jgi:hypothetical protein
MIEENELLILDRDGVPVGALAHGPRARAAGFEAQRVGCYAGGDGELVRFYESAGFTRTEPFDVHGWPGRLLERRA